MRELRTWITRIVLKSCLVVLCLIVVLVIRNIVKDRIFIHEWKCQMKEMEDKCVSPATRGEYVHYDTIQKDTIKTDKNERTIRKD